MQSKFNGISRRTVLLLPATVLGSNSLASSLGSATDRCPANALLRNQSNFVNPEIPKNWKQGVKSLDNAKFNPYGRTPTTIKAIFRRKRKGFPHAAYGVMGTVLELRKPLGQIPED